MQVPQSNIRFFLPRIVIALIAICSLIPGNSLPDSHLPFLDKIVHFIMYGTLAFTYYLAYSNKKHIFFAMTVVPTCWGVLFECLQMFVPNRSASLDDAVANAIGAFLVTVVTMLGSRIKH